MKTYHVPVLVAGLKLGMFAAVGGGIMGYTTGKMFAEHEYSPGNLLMTLSHCVQGERGDVEERFLDR